MLPPFVYPFLGIAYLIKRPDMLLQVLGFSVLHICVPLFWFSDSLVNKHHNQVFDQVFSNQYGNAPVRQLSEAQRDRLAAKVVERQQKKQARARTNPLHQDGRASGVARTLLFVLGPPQPGAPLFQRVAKRILQAPIKLLFPAAPKLLAVTSAPALAASALSPWLVRKGIRGANEIDTVAAVNRASMVGFGGVAFALGLLPVLSWILGFTNAVGAAIWAADLEREKVALI